MIIWKKGIQCLVSLTAIVAVSGGYLRDNLPRSAESTSNITIDFGSSDIDSSSSGSDVGPLIVQDGKEENSYKKNSRELHQRHLHGYQPHYHNIYVPVQQDNIIEKLGKGRTSKGTMFESLLTALAINNLDTVLEGTGPFTLFAPTDDAFEECASLLAQLSDVELIEVLKYHVLASKVPKNDISDGSLTTFQGENIIVDVKRSGTYLNPGSIRGGNGAKVRQWDISASNGIIHVINEVLIPPSITVTKPPTMPPTKSPMKAPQSSVRYMYVPRRRYFRTYRHHHKE